MGGVGRRGREIRPEPLTLTETCCSCFPDMREPLDCDIIVNEARLWAIHSLLACLGIEKSKKNEGGWQRSTRSHGTSPESIAAMTGVPDVPEGGKWFSIACIRILYEPARYR